MAKNKNAIKFLGCELNADDVSRIESEMARRLNGGLPASRAQLIREAIRKAYPLPKRRDETPQPVAIPA